jgi:hypothetical protein
MDNQQDISEISNIVVTTINWALSTSPNYSVVPPSQNSSNREFWPDHVNVSTLAWVTSQGWDTETSICALAIGSRFTTGYSYDMLRGAALHNAILPVVVRALQSQGINAMAEWSFFHAKPGISGRVDLYIPECATVELKTTSATRRTPYKYELIQCGLYAYLVAPCILVVTSVSQNRVIIRQQISSAQGESLSRDAIGLLEEYHRWRGELNPSPNEPLAIGRCSICSYNWICEKNQDIRFVGWR